MSGDQVVLSGRPGDSIESLADARIIVAGANAGNPGTSDETEARARRLVAAPFVARCDECGRLVPCSDPGPWRTCSDCDPDA